MREYAGISVVICCYNSAKKIIPTLEHLAKQENPCSLSYELIIVDNNCIDDTIALANEIWLSLAAPFPLKVVKQPIPGLKHAKDKGINYASYDYIVLCDDDNWLCDIYLFTVYQLFAAMPKVAVIGGVGEPVFETKRPSWFNEIGGFGYAIGEEGRETGLVNSVYGAGMAIRKEIYFAVMNNEIDSVIIGRTGSRLLSGEDIELCMFIKRAGYDILFNGTLKFKHFLTGNRLTWNYYLKLRSSFGKASAYLRLYNDEELLAFAMHKKNSLKEAGSLLKFAAFHFKFLLFPYLFKNAQCANFIQQWSMRITSLVENKKIKILADAKIQRLKNEKLALKHEKNIC